MRFTTYKSFERAARVHLREHYGVMLAKRKLPEIPKEFDMVSSDGAIVGVARYLSFHEGESLALKFAIIAEDVWLLEKIEAAEKFLVFGNDRRLPQMWLERHRNLLGTVRFFFFDGKLEQLYPPVLEDAPPGIPAWKFENILQRHRKWIESGLTEGERADISEAYLQGVHLEGVYLEGARLRRANLQRACLVQANLRLADLRGTDLRMARLRNANLSGASLQGAYLSGAYLQGVDLFGADLTRAQMQGTDLTGANLRSAKLSLADLTRADLTGSEGLTLPQVKTARNWELAFYSDDFLKRPIIKTSFDELAELEKEREAIFRELEGRELERARVEMFVRLCHVCGETKKIKDFQIYSNDRILWSICKICHKLQEKWPETTP